MRVVLRLLIVAALVLSFLPTSTQAVSYGAFAGKVLPTSTDFNPIYAALGTTPTICSRDTGIGGTFTDDLYYLHLAGSGTTVSTFDVRLTSAGGFTAGTIVSSADSDSTQTFTGTGPGLTSGCAAFEANVGYVEADGLPGYSPGDEVVWSSDLALGTGDIRLSTSAPQDGSAVTAGTYVKASDADVSAFGDNDGSYPDCVGSPPTGATCSGDGIIGKTGFALRLFDANINGVPDTGDTLYLALLPAATPAAASPNINDVYLYPGAGGSFGTKVTRSSADYLAEPKNLVSPLTPPTLGTVGTVSTCSPLIIHFGESLGASTPFIVQMNDIVLHSTSSACASPQPTTSITSGTRVSTTTHHQGTAFTVAPVALPALIYYVDLNGNSLYDSADPVYLHRPATLGGTGAAPPATGIVAGDLRLTAVTAGATSFGAGTLVGGSDADIGSFASLSTNVGSGTQSWFVRLINNDDASETPLTAATLVKYHENSAVANTIWDPTTDPVYVDTDSSGTVTAGDIRLSKGSAGGLIDYTGLTDGPTQVVAAEADVGKALTASADFKVSGGDATFDDGRGEAVYYSKDAIVNNEDFRIQRSSLSGLTAKQQVVCPPTLSPHVDCTNEGVHASDRLQFSWCVTATACFGRLQPNDLQVSPTLGTRTTTTVGADFIPTLKALPTDGGRLLRQNLGESTSIVDDTFYISGHGTTPGVVTTSAVRITPLIAQSKAAGTFVVTGDTIDLFAGATASTATAASLIRFRDTDGLGGYTLNDLVYMDLEDPPVTGATSGTLGVADVRLTALSGFSGGTFVLAGNSDLNAGTAWATGAFTLSYFDDNQNNVFDNGDMLYAIPPSPASTTQPVLGAVYLAGTTAAVSSGGGGGSSTVVTTTTTSSTVTTSGTTSVSGSESVSSTDSGTDTPLSLASINLALQASLEVERKDGENVLTWDSQPGVTGYQVWASASPFVLLATLDSQSANTYTHAEGTKDTQYLVTAYQGNGTLTAEDVNNGVVPGYSGVPEGKDADSGGGGKGWIPGPGLAVMVLALAAAVLVARRKL